MSQPISKTITSRVDQIEENFTENDKSIVGSAIRISDAKNDGSDYRTFLFDIRHQSLLAFLKSLPACSRVYADVTSSPVYFVDARCKIADAVLDELVSTMQQLTSAEEEEFNGWILMNIIYTE